MRLYEITGAMLEVQHMLDDGIPADQLADTLAEIKIDFNDKAGSILYVIANMKGEIEACKAEEERLNSRRKSKETQIENLKEYLLYNMVALNSSKIDNGLMTASIRKGAPVLQIIDEDAIPNDFKKISTSIATDKRALLAALKELKEGETITGAAIVQGKNSLTIK